MGDRMGGAPAPHQSSQNVGAPLMPTWRGFVGSTMDALVLFEACLAGDIAHVPRRPHDRERAQLIVSGNVFIYEEHSSGIKRWTDGVPWSPSRILGNFLLYRELDKPFQPGEKKRAMKKTKENGISKSTAPQRSNSVGYGGMIAGGGAYPGYSENTGSTRDNERMLVGSLVDSYQFKADGLIKKTISVNFNNVSHHLVSYYSVEDAKQGRLREVRDDPRFRDVSPRGALISAGNFRAPVDDTEVVVTDRMFGGHMGVPMQIGEFASLSRSMSVPSVHAYPGSNGWPPNPYMAASHQYSHMNTPVPTVTFPPSATPNYSYEIGGHQRPILQQPNYSSLQQHRRGSLHGDSSNGLGMYGSGGPVVRSPLNGNHNGLLSSNGHAGTNGMGHGSMHSSALYDTAGGPHGSSRHDGSHDSAVSNQHHPVYDHDGSHQNGTSFSAELGSSFGSAVPNHGGFKGDFDATVRAEAVTANFETSPNGYHDALGGDNIFSQSPTFARHHQ